MGSETFYAKINAVSVTAQTDSPQQEQTMKRSIIKTLLLTTAVTLSTAASADTRFIEAWNCKLLDGKTIEQVQAANKVWLTFVNGNVEGGGVKSYVMTSVVGDSTSFMFVDSYPSLTTWSATKAALKTPEGVAAEAGIIGVSLCPTNTLHESTES
jgi:hypothetical protein